MTKTQWLCVAKFWIQSQYSIIYIMMDAVHLFYYEGYSTAQIASIVGRPEVTVRSDLRRARIKLKDMLGEERGDEADL